MGNGLPQIGLPHFSISDGNRTYDFLETTAAMGTTLFSVPIVSTIEHMAIAKAFGMLYHWPLETTHKIRWLSKKLSISINSNYHIDCIKNDPAIDLWS